MIDPDLHRETAAAELADELRRVVESWGTALVNPQAKGDNIVGLQHMMFTWALLEGLTPWSYERRWCYSSYEQAAAALDAWDGADDTEPQGWHRAVDGSGRRRPDGDASKEYVEH